MNETPGCNIVIAAWTLALLICWAVPEILTSTSLPVLSLVELMWLIALDTSWLDVNVALIKSLLCSLKYWFNLVVFSVAKSLAVLPSAPR